MSFQCTHLHFLLRGGEDFHGIAERGLTPPEHAQGFFAVHCHGDELLDLAAAAWGHDEPEGGGERRCVASRDQAAEALCIEVEKRRLVEDARDALYAGDIGPLGKPHHVGKHQAARERDQHKGTYVDLVPQVFRYGVMEGSVEFLDRRVDYDFNVLVWRALHPLGSDYTIVHTHVTVSYTHLRAHETRHDLVCRLLLEKKKK